MREVTGLQAPIHEQDVVQQSRSSRFANRILLERVVIFMRIRTGKCYRLLPRVLAIAAAAGLALTSSACVQEDESPAQPTSHTEYVEQINGWAEDYAQCLRDKGVDARVVTGPNGVPSIDPAYGPGIDPDDLWNGMLDPECIEAAGEPPEVPEVTEDYKEASYELRLEQAECLRDNGYVIGESPTLEEWMEDWDRNRWDPVSELSESGQDGLEATEACPDPSGLDVEERMLENLGEDGSVE